MWGASQKFWDPSFRQLLNLMTSNLVYNLGLQSSLTKITFRTKIGGGLGLGEHPKKCDPLFISATIEASNFKFDTQLGLDE